MKKGYVFFLLGVALVFSGCSAFPFGFKSNELVGSGNVAAESRVTSGFSAVEVSGGGELVVTQGNTEMLTIEADDNVLPQVETKVEEGVLHIQLNTKPFEKITLKNKIFYKVQMKRVDSLSMSGGGSITGQNLSADLLTVSMNGGGDATLTGTCKNLEITINGGTKFQAGDLQCKDSIVSISGGGAVTVWASDSLAVTGVGASVVNYYDSPKITQNGSTIVMTSLGTK